MFAEKPAAFVVLGIAVLMSLVACEGFYSDVPTATPGPPASQASATISPEFTGTTAEIAVAAARAALAERLGIDPREPSFAGLRGATWTRSNPGCYPLPEEPDSAYLVPGLRLSLVYDAVRYEYATNMPVTVGALCVVAPQTRQEVSVSLAGDVVRTQDPSRLAGRVVTLWDANDARAFLYREPGIAEIDVEDIDWPAEVVIGTALPDTPSALEVADAAGIWDIDSNVVTIEVQTSPAETPAEASGEGAASIPVWVLVEYPPAGASFEFQIVQSPSGAASP